MSYCPKIDNTLLIAALALNREIRVYCKKTSVKVDEFKKEFPDTATHIINECDVEYRCRNGCEYNIQQLSFWY